MARKRKPRPTTGIRQGHRSWIRLSPQYPSERRRTAESWSGRIGSDLKTAIRELAEETGLTQGEIGRKLIYFGLMAVEDGELDLENGQFPRE